MTTTTRTTNMVVEGTTALGDSVEEADLADARDDARRAGEPLEGRQGSEGRIIEALLKAAAHLIDNDESDPMKVAVRVAVEQLHKRDSALRRECLLFAAEQLADARSRWVLHTTADEIVIDVLRAACLARTGRDGDVDSARTLFDAARSLARAALLRRDEELARLDASEEPGARLRAATLRKEPLAAIEELDAIARDLSASELLGPPRSTV